MVFCILYKNSKPMKFKYFYFILFTLFSLGILFLGCDNLGKDSSVKVTETISDSTLNKANGLITDTLLKSTIQVLADDSLMGRKPFTMGEVRTLRYLEKQCKILGLKPGNHGSYFQNVPMVQVTSVPSAPMHISGKSTEFNLDYKKDFVASTRREQDSIHLVNSPLVFVGFGIIAPEYHWNDYAGLNVKGKTVVVLVNDPGFGGIDPHFFKGDTMTYYGRWTYKYEEAARQGAAAVLIIHQTKPASYAWSVVNNSFTGDKLYLQEADKHKSRCKVEGWFSEDAGNHLLAAAGLGITVDQATQNARKRGFKAIPLGLNLSLDLDNKLLYSTSHNVIGILPGDTNPAENIIYTAHWDHLGIGPKVNGDSIYNGAIDNASGVAAILAIAKAFESLKVPLHRNVLFLMVTGEEQGLLGSEYYANHPIFPLDKTVADINLDALGGYGPTKDISLVGLGQSELDDYVKKEAEKGGRYVVGDPNPGAGSYFRSDHFNFAKVGVPALDLGEGTESTSKGSEWGKKMQEDYNDHHYHQPSDEYSSSMDASGMVQNTSLLFRVGYRLSGESTIPFWKPGSEFKAIREKYMPKANSKD